MSSGGDSILDMYLYETNTLLEQLDGILLAAEQADTFSEENVNEIFRIMHTIKGSSAMMEFTSLMRPCVRNCSTCSSRRWISSAEKSRRWKTQNHSLSLSTVL